MKNAKQKWYYYVFPFLHWVPLLNQQVIKSDVVAGITAGVLILPQSIALAALAGMPPEYGLYTSIFPVMFAALFGSSWHAMSGPNTAICILIAFTIAPYASVASPEWIQYAITLAFMAAVIQITFGVLRLGVVFNYFSQTVMVALITGVGFIIILSQLGNFMGVLMNTAEPIENTLPQIAYAVTRANWFAVAIGTVTVAAGFLVKRYHPNQPFLIIAVVGGMVFAIFLELVFSPTFVQLDKLGMMSLSAFPLSAPDFSPENYTEAAQGLLPAAFFIAFLGLIQASVIARAMAEKSGQHIDVNQEALGQGVANLAGSFLSCFPSCSSFNRSASNFEAGARTPLSALVSVLALVVIILFATPIIAHMPIAVMSGVLILVGIGLIKKRDIKKIMNEAWETRIIFLLILGTTLYGGLDYAVFFGIALSIFSYLRIASKPQIELLIGKAAIQYMPQHTFQDTSEKFMANEKSKIKKYRSEIPYRIKKAMLPIQENLESPNEPEIDIEIQSQINRASVLQISGSLFFGSVHNIEHAFTNLNRQDNRKADLVISAENMQYLDITGAEALKREVEKRKLNNARISIWLRNHSLDKMIISSGLLSAVGKKNIHYINLQSSFMHSKPSNLH